MHADGLEDILKEFPPVLESVRHICRRSREILFPLRQSRGIDTNAYG